MKQPTRQQHIKLRIWRANGTEYVEGVTGMIEYPLAIHRDLSEHSQIQEGTRSRYSGIWTMTHVPTGKSFGIRSRNWQSIVYYVEQIKDHPALLMITDETMTAHPMFKDLSDLHSRLRREIL